MKEKVWIIMLAAMTAGSNAVAVTWSEEGDVKAGVPGPAYSLNEVKSTLSWKGSKPGGEHFGTIEVVSGNASTDGSVITGGSFQIDMNSIKNNDISNEGMRDRLISHLKSEDFFDVENHPVARFHITDVMTGEGITQMITGDLTIRGTAHEISFPAEITIGDRKIHARTGEIRLDRTRWNVNHMSKSIFAEMKDRYIDDEMIISLDLHFDRQQSNF